MELIDYIQLALQIIRLPEKIMSLTGFTPAQKGVFLLLSVLMIVSDLNGKKKDAKKKKD